MYKIGILVRLTRIQYYLPVVLLVFPLIFLISPDDFFTHKTLIIFLSNLFLTAFGFTFNDVEDATDDYYDFEKRKRNPISSGELTHKQSYFISFTLLSLGLFLLLFVSYYVFLLGIIFAFGGFFYSWKPLRLKSIPFVDMITHVIFLGVIQFFITYLSFRSLDWFVIPFLMIIIPFSLMIEIFGELKDFEVDKKTNINNTIQKFERLDIKKLVIFLFAIVITGFSIIIFTIPPEFRIINLSITLFIGIVAMLRINRRARQYI